MIREQRPATSIRLSTILIAGALLATVVSAATTAFVTTSANARSGADRIAAPIPGRKGAPPTDGRATARRVSTTSFERATERQMSFLGALVRRRGWDATRRDVEARQVLGYDRDQLDLSKQEASRLITAWDDRKGSRPK